VPDRGQPRRNDDRDAEPGTGGHDTAGGDLGHAGKEPSTGHAGAAGGQTRPVTPEAADQAEAAAESNRNKDFDTPHVHSGTTSRRV
jgi:hypothetical protein